MHSMEALAGGYETAPRDEDSNEVCALDDHI